MAREDQLRAREAAFRLHLALVANGSLTEESFNKAKDHATSAYEGVIELLRPWSDSKSTKDAEYDELIELYKKVCGDPNDPAFKSAIEADARKMMADVIEAGGESEAQRQQNMIAKRFEEARKRRQGG